MSYLYLLKQEWKYAALKDKIYIVLSISFHIISHIGIVLLPLFFKELINSLEGIQDNSLNDSIVWLFMLFVCFLVFEAFHRLGRFIEYAAGCRIRENCVDKLYRHVYSLPLAWHQANHSGNTINRVRLASESLFTFILYQHTFIRTFVLATGPFIATLFFAPDIAIIICLLVFVSLLANFKFDKILIPIIRKKNENIHSFTAVLFDFISNIETLITLGIGQMTETVLKKKSMEVSKGNIAENNLNQIKCQVMSLIGFTIQTGILAYFIFSRLDVIKAITIGTVIQVYQYCTLIRNSTAEFSGNYFDLVRWATDFSSVDIIRNSKIARNEFNQKVNKDWGVISISRLNFHYALQSKAGQDIHTKKYIFKEFSLLLKNHTKIALTGASGSGKSTLFKLLRGLYKPESILLKMDSKEFNNLKPLTPLVTLVPQLQDIFENTIRYNITLGSDVDENELEIIAYTAGIKPLLRRLKKGLDTDLREKGINLSGGERQRIALARGLLAARNSSILLLDEVTSNIDMQTENRIYKRIFELYKDRCLIVSVHRLYLLKIFDTVIALD